jgi:thiol-disulfide isomerase/thioredoxin
MVSFAPPPFPEDANWILSGETQPPSWEKYLGKVVVVQSWTNFSGNGRLAVKTVDRAVANSSSPDDVVLLTIHTPQGHTAAAKYIKKKNINHPVLIDSTGIACNSFGFYKHPTNIVVDKNGAVQHIGLGAKGLTSAIDDLLCKEFDPETKPKTFAPSTEKEAKPAKYPKHSKKIGRANDMQGKNAPSFHVEEWVANEIEVADRVHVVEFWATWCPPCRKSIPHLNELAKQFVEDVCFVGVTAENKSKVESFMKETPMKYGVAIDTQKTMQNAIRCKAIPLALVISSDGIVRWQGNPAYLTNGIIQQVLSADRGERVPPKRGRWDTLEVHE